MTFRHLSSMQSNQNASIFSESKSYCRFHPPNVAACHFVVPKLSRLSADMNSSPTINRDYISDSEYSCGLMGSSLWLTHKFRQTGGMPRCHTLHSKWHGMLSDVSLVEQTSYHKTTFIIFNLITISYAFYYCLEK